MFDKLTKDDVAKIAEIMLQRVENSLKDKNITLTVTKSALDWLIDKGYDAEYGARRCAELSSKTSRTKLPKLLSTAKSRTTTT